MDFSVALPFLSWLVSMQKRYLKTSVVLPLVSCIYSLLNYTELEEHHKAWSPASWQERRQSAMLW